MKQIEMITVAIINQKGGVGKSTTTINLAYELAQRYKVLLIDLDPQAHTSQIYTNQNKEFTIKDLLLNPRTDITQAILPAQVNGKTILNLSLIPSNIHLARVVEQVTGIYREKRLANHLLKVKNTYDYCLLDCPPNLGIITVNAIYTANCILIPITADRGALDGMADLLPTIQEVKESSQLFYFILKNNIDIRNKQTNNYLNTELKNYQSKLIPIVIHRAEVINQARIVGEPVQLFSPSSKSTLSYRELGKWFVNCIIKIYN